jgi:pimeloyl-ACP methyl ester carboxylesterase
VPKTKMKDLIVLVPGIMGSVLSKDGHDVWALSPGALFRGLVSLGHSIKDLALTSDPINDDCPDGVRAERLMPDAHLIPGFWKIDGYSQISELIKGSFEVVAGQNYFEFPYDWRRDNRVASRQLAAKAPQWLASWRNQSGNKDAKIIFICHSMGGLVARHFLELHDGWKDASMLITFGTPFRGSLKALGFLANGLSLGVFGLKLADFGPTLRTFTSIYQLLPTFDCYDPDGSKKLVGLMAAGAIPNLDMAKVQAAMSFYQGMDDAAHQGKGRPASYLTHPIVGIEQPTYQSACLTGGRLALLENRNGEDAAGDGTVPRISATPLELLGAQTEVYAAECHGSLQNGDDTLRQVRGLLSGLQVYKQTVRGLQGSAVSLELTDLNQETEPVRIRARAGDSSAILTAVVVNADTGNNLGRKTMRETADGWMSAEFGPLPEGIYRVTINGNGVNAVNDLFTVLQ